MKKDITEYYKAKFIDKYGDKYDYSKTQVVKSSDKVIVTCKVHGDFLVTPNNHLSKGSGCPSCKNTDKNFIDYCSNIHNNYYDYSLVEYKNNRTRIKIICPKHGVFEQLPMNHKSGSICPKCSNDKRRSNISDLMDMGHKLHSNKYDYKYLEYDYSNSGNKVRIVCPKHGVFKQDAFSHFMRGYGCKLCKRMSNGEVIVGNILDDNNIEYISQKTFDDCINQTKLSFDFYIPKYNLCVEFNGRQHYEPISVFGGSEQFTRQLKNDKIKRDYCNSRGIQLLIIKYDDNIIDSLSKYLKVTEDTKYNGQSLRYLRHSQWFNNRIDR